MRKSIKCYRIHNSIQFGFSIYRSRYEYSTEYEFTLQFLIWGASLYVEIFDGFDDPFKKVITA